MSEEEDGLRVNSRLLIPGAFLEESFIRSSGPGGQNVNKVATAVQLRFDARGARVLSDEVAVRLMKLAGSRTTKAGEILIEASRHRTQERNRQDARERLAHFIEGGLHAPKPRVATKPSRGAKERRLGEKRGRATIKQGRAGKGWD